jgi:hypothetical protein
MADPVSVLKDYDAAWNAHDVEGVMAFFTDDALVRMEPPPPDEFGGVYPSNSGERLSKNRRFTRARRPRTPTLSNAFERCSWTVYSEM